MHAPSPDPNIHDLSDDALLLSTDAGYIEANASALRWLELIAEVDRRRLWAVDGHHGLASWLRWKYRMCRQTSKEKARVARGCVIWRAAAAAFAAGEIAYSSLRHIVRLPSYDPDTEARLIEVGRYGTADDVARLVNRALDLHAQNRERPDRGRSQRDDERDGATGAGGGEEDRKGDTESNGEEADDAFDRRRFWAARTLGGTVTGGFTLGPVEGALLLAAIDTYLDGRHPGSPRAEGVAAATPSVPTANDPRTIDQRRADGFVEMICAYLAGGSPDTSGADRHTVNVLCDLTTLTTGEWNEGSVCETVDGTPVTLSRLEQLRCDATLVRVLTNDSRILDIGTRNRTVPAALRKKLLLRDRGCRFPGCPHSRWIDAHHLTAVADDGPTDADNLVMLCGFHHHLVHAKRWKITGDPETGNITFLRPDGTPVPEVPPLRKAS